MELLSGVAAAWEFQHKDKNWILPCLISQNTTGPCIYRGDTQVQTFQMALPEPQTQQMLAKVKIICRGAHFPLLRDPEPCSAGRAQLRLQDRKNHCPVLALTLWKKLQKVWSAAGAENKLQFLPGGVSPPACWCVYNQHLSHY